MKKRLWLLIALCIVMVATVSLAACGGSGGSDSGSASSGAASTSASSSSAGETSAAEAPEGDNLTASKALMASLESVKGSDNQSLLIYGEAREVPARPDDPDALSEDDPLKYWDIEYAGRETQKEPAIESPADGCIGKKVIAIGQSEHPY